MLMEKQRANGDILSGGWTSLAQTWIWLRYGQAIRDQTDVRNAFDDGGAQTAAAAVP
jgi:hypothetical protein